MGGQFTEFRRLLTVHGSVSFCTRNADFVLYFNVFICIKVIDVQCTVSSICKRVNYSEKGVELAWTHLPNEKVKELACTHLNEIVELA